MFKSKCTKTELNINNHLLNSIKFFWVLKLLHSIKPVAIIEQKF